MALEPFARLAAPAVEDQSAIPLSPCVPFLEFMGARALTHTSRTTLWQVSRKGAGLLARCICLGLHMEATLDTRYFKPRFRQRVQTCTFIFHSAPTMSLCDHHIPSGRGLLCSCALSHAFAPVHRARLREVSLFMPADVVDSFVQMLCERARTCENMNPCVMMLLKCHLHKRVLK